VLEQLVSPIAVSPVMQNGIDCTDAALIGAAKTLTSSAEKVGSPAQRGYNRKRMMRRARRNGNEGFCSKHRIL
jgi:hypothetical protein